ncbi:MAG: GNAT family N-acetyltransferase [Thermomicrobiales bacterium]
MDLRFVQTDFAGIEPEVRAHLASLPTATDSFHEHHVLTAMHYRILVGGEVAGFASIHAQEVITQFALAIGYRFLGQQVFARLRRFEHVRAALVPTNDEFFVVHALDDYRTLSKQACFFAVAESRVPPIPAGLRLRQATTEDIALIRDETDEEFEPVEQFIANGELFVTEREGQAVGVGIMDVSKLYERVASIGMATFASHRNQGVGTATIAMLIGECGRRGLRPVAGCWYYNHASKRTLEKAGMYSPTRYLRVEY